MEWLYPRKIVDFIQEKSIKQMKKCLNRVDKKDGEAAIIGNSQIFEDKSIGDKLRSQNLVKKIILKGSAGNFFP